MTMLRIPTALRRRVPVLLLAAFALAAAGCGDAGDAGAGDAVRETLPGGGTLVRYAALPTEPTHMLEPDLVLGVLEGEEWEMFGDVRGFDAGSDGAIYILDFHPRVIRVFGADGAYLRTLGGPGDGPGELTQANGLLKEPGGLLWVNDHGKMRILGLRSDGTEVLRAPFPVPGWGYAWPGERDAEGRFWEGMWHRDGANVMPDPGLNEASGRLWFHAVHPETEVRDSVFIGEQHSRSWMTAFEGGGFSLMAIPFEARSATILDPEGGFWTTEGADYRIVRLDAGGDTALVLEAGVPRATVTAGDRDALLERLTVQGNMPEPAARELLRAGSDRHPAVTQLFLDDRGRVWVGRGRGTSDLPPLWDVFERDGSFVASVEPAFMPSSTGILPRIRNENAHFLVSGEGGEPTVVRAPVHF